MFLLKTSAKNKKDNNGKRYLVIFIKSLNALAFNMVALYYQQNNKSLKKNAKAMLNSVEWKNLNEHRYKNSDIKTGSFMLLEGGDALIKN